jgi:hypothetical protein
MKTGASLTLLLAVGLFGIGKASAQTCYGWVSSGSNGCCSGIVCTDGTGSGYCSPCYTAKAVQPKTLPKHDPVTQLAGIEMLTINSRVLRLNWSQLTSPKIPPASNASKKTEVGGM